MLPSIFQSIYTHPKLDSSDLREIAEAHCKTEFAKGDVVLEKGKISNTYYIIESGLFRSFTYDYNGNEITTELTSPGEFIIEVSSLFQRIPSEENIVAITDGVVWKLDFEVFQELFHKIEGLREWGRSWMSNQLFISKQRAIEIRTKSTAERYLALLNERPEIIQQVPLKDIASYLGVTDTSLSRIRKEIINT